MNVLRIGSRWLRAQKMLFVTVTLSAVAIWLGLRLVGPQVLPPRPVADVVKALEVVWAPSPQPAANELSGPWQHERAAAEIFEPSLIALPGERGFSNRVAQGRGAVTYQWPQLLQQPLLTEPTTGFVVRSPVLPPETLAQLMAARVEKLQPPTFEEIESPVVTQDATTVPILEFRGALQNRSIITPFVLPALSSEPPSLPSKFTVAVDADGRVRAVIAEASSGNKEADDKAAETLRHCVFAPAKLLPGAQGEGGGLDWGTVVVSWPRKPPAAPDKKSDTEPSP